MEFDCATCAAVVLPGMALLLVICLLLLRWGLAHRTNAMKAERDLTWVTAEWKKRATDAEAQVQELAKRILQMEASQHAQRR